MIEVFCCKCGKELNEKGGVIISPPETEPSKLVDKGYKMHLCLQCYFKLMDWFNEA